MTIFGAVWIFILLYVVIKNKNETLVSLVLFSSVFQSSNVLVYGTQGIGPQVITTTVASFYFILKAIYQKKIITKKYSNIIRILMIFLVYIVLNSILTASILYNYIRIIQLSSYVICFILFTKVGENLDDDYVYITLRKITVFILIVGVIQYLCTIDVIPRYWFIRDIFWNDSVNNPEVVQFMWPFGPYYRFFSTYMEPSYFIGFSIGAIFYFFNYKEKRQNNYIIITSLVIATILSLSSSGYGALLLTGIIYLFFSKRDKIKIYGVIICILVFLILYIGFYDILDMVIFSKMQSGSANARMTWNLEAFNTFKSSPIIGIGYKGCRASSIIYTVLAELGIIGVLIYVLFLFSIFNSILTRKKRKLFGNEYIGIVYALIGVTFSQIIAVPDFDICTFWMWMHFLGLLIGKNKRSSKK